MSYTKLISIDHSQPSTSILSITKPLIYSRKILLWLEKKWPQKRDLTFSFCGLITKQRRSTIENWINVNYNSNVNLEKDDLLFRIKRKILNTLSLQRLLIRKYDQVFIWSSNKGRTFPTKSWDNDYYNFLLKSKFVLCPSGDFIWTYRFFESIMCGAIPIVEETCPSYDGFKFYTMAEDISKIQWTEEIAKFNFQLCMERLTLSDEEMKVLKTEIIQLTKNRRNLI